jgi:chromate reductase, NAD(P)H dehydrogenase (quinone)
MSFSHPHRRRLERFVRRTLLYKHLIRMRVLAISGSLRSKSTNTVLLRALAELAPPEIEIVLFQELDRIPPFNPDLEAENGTGPVARFRAALRETGAVIFSTPEYAHGLPGVLKNALDWVVGSGELSRKLVVLVNASSRGTYAQASLKEILKTMDATVLHDAEVTINLLGKNLTPAEIARDPTFASSLVISLQSLLTLAFMARPDKSVRLDDGQS